MKLDQTIDLIAAVPSGINAFKLSIVILSPIISTSSLMEIPINLLFSS